MKIFRLGEKDISKDDTKYPVSTGTIEGLAVLKEIPNTGSIRSTLDKYKILNGIRIVPMSDFNISGKSYSISENERIHRLSEQIRESGEISPLIVVVENEGPYVLEGAHRIDALYNLGVKFFPALVVISMDEE